MFAVTNFLEQLIQCLERVRIHLRVAIWSMNITKLIEITKSRLAPSPL